MPNPARPRRPIRVVLLGAVLGASCALSIPPGTSLGPDWKAAWLLAWTARGLIAGTMIAAALTLRRARQGEGTAAARAWAWLVLALAPAVVVILEAGTFFTQDGPAHLYNASVLVATLRGESWAREAFRVSWSPLPNWAGHLAAMGAVATLPPTLADRALAVMPLIGLAAATLWLGLRVAGTSAEGGGLCAALFAATVGMNVAWLFGFTSFLLGGCLFAVTLGEWWTLRDRPGLAPGLRLAGWIALGYFAHLVSLGLTTIGLVVLTLSTPGSSRARARTLAIALSPLLVLGPVYRSIMSRGGGPIEPVWAHFGSIGSQLGWADPITLGKKGALPAVALVLAAVAVLAIASIRRADRDRRGWAILAAILVFGGLVTPDTLGRAHGNYLPQRVVLLGLVALAPALQFGASRRAARVACGLLGLAVGVQTVAIARYARECDLKAGPVARSLAAVGRGQRIGTLLINIRGEFRSNPVMHADNILGVGTGNVVWCDYETSHYYFPVQFRDDRPHPLAKSFEDVAILDAPRDRPKRARLWADLLDRHHEQMDILLVWGSETRLDAINARYFDPEPFHRDGPVRLYRHR